jgi:hypothetical protein
MASKHQLSLEIIQSNNCSLFRVIDTSIYTPDLEVTCATLQITVPGFNDTYSISVASGFEYSLTGCLIGVQTTDCNSIAQTLPDGAYTVKYSVSPNDKVFVEYNFLNTCAFLNRYYTYLCQIELAACEPQPDVRAQLDELRLIKSFHDAAKAKIEQCNDVTAGMELFNYARKRLDRFGKNCC